MRPTDEINRGNAGPDKRRENVRLRGEGGRHRRRTFAVRNSRRAGSGRREAYTRGRPTAIIITTAPSHYLRGGGYRIKDIRYCANDTWYRRRVCIIDERIMNRGGQGIVREKYAFCQNSGGFALEL